MGTEGFDKGPRGLTSYLPVAITKGFSSLMARLSGEKARVEAEHNALLQECRASSALMRRAQLGTSNNRGILTGRRPNWRRQ
jgi:hypothetical protein